MNALTAGDPLRQQVGKIVLTDGHTVIRWDGTHLVVSNPEGRVVHRHRVCAIDSNAEEVAKAWWFDHDNKSLIERFIEHADW